MAALYLEFKGKRLFVGYRRRDWSKVWYEPIEDADTDGTAPLGLFSSKSGLQTREPMEGEVLWLPHFEPTTLDSKFKRERERMQMQFMYDTFRYMREKNTDNVTLLDQELDHSGYTRWQMWFRVMKAEKNERKKRRQRREQMVLDVGLRTDDVIIDSDASDVEGIDEQIPNNSENGLTHCRKRVQSGYKKQGRSKKARNAADVSGDDPAIRDDITGINFDNSTTVVSLDSRAHHQEEHGEDDAHGEDDNVAA